MQNDVGWLQIVMDDAFLVGRIESLANLPRDGQRVRDRQGPARQTIGERWSLDEFENKRRDAVGFFQPINRADVRVIQRREETRLALEARSALGVSGEACR